MHRSLCSGSGWWGATVRCPFPSEPDRVSDAPVSRRNHSALITGVVPGDYDGDSQMDVLLTYLPKNHVDGGLGAVIFWGKNQTLGESVLGVSTTSHWIGKGILMWQKFYSEVSCFFKKSQVLSVSNYVKKKKTSPFSHFYSQPRPVLRSVPENKIQAG